MLSLAPAHAAHLLVMAARNVGTLRGLYDPAQPRDDRGQWSGGNLKGSTEFGRTHDPSLVSEEVGQRLLRIGDAISDENDIAKVYVTGNEREYNVQVINSDKGRRLSFNVSKGEQKIEAYLDIVEFQETTTPRQARAALARTIDVLSKEGVDEVALDATLSDGGYLWARLGFQARNPEGFKEMVSERVGSINRNYQTSRLMHDEYTREELDGLVHIINTNNARPDLPQIIADTPGGKSFLRGSSWGGVLKLREPGATDRIDHFLGRRRKAA